MLSEARYYARMAWHFGRFIKAAPITDPEAVIRETLSRREENFLTLVRRGIFENPKSPYGQLFRLADCTFEDLRDSVRKTGLEKALQILREAGIYLTHEEVKGKPIQRHGKTIPNDIAATKNPGSSGGMESVSSGSRSSGTATPTSNEYRIYRECYERLAYQELGAKDRVVGFLRPILPSPNALTSMVGLARSGQPAERWFTVGKSFRTNGPYALATRLLVAEARLLGCHVPFPTFLDKDDFRPVARWVAENVRRGKPTLLRSGVSWATRMCAAAIEENLDISGTVMIVGGEAISPARRRIFQTAGVQPIGRYAISEMGTVGIGCPQLTGNSVHLLADAVAVIEHRRPAPFVDAEVNSLLFTSVHPLASRVYINAEMEDAGTLVPATCDCGYSRVGFRTVIQDVYSFGKLSSQGMTLTGDALLSILEERLPERFGGGPGDYQLVEIEGAAQAELRLRVSPRLRSVDLGEVQGFFLEQVRRIYGGSLSVRTWESTSSIKAEAIEPYQTRTGKGPCPSLGRVWRQPMTLTRRSLLPALAGSLLVACHKGRQPLSKIRVAVSPRVAHAPIYLAYEKGLFQKEGLDVELVEYVSPLDTIPALAGNRVEVSCATFSPGICNAAARGARIRIVATRESIKPGCSDQGALYYRRSRFSQGLEQAEAWKGARIALPADSNAAAFYLAQILAANKLSTTAVEISRMRVEDALAAASSGQIDVFFGSGRPEFLNGGLPKDFKRSDVLVDMLGEFQYAYILYGPALLDGDPAVGTSLLRAYLAGVQRYVNGETPQFLDDLAARMHMNPKLVKSECRSNVSIDGEIHTQDLDRWVRWAIASGAAAGSITADQLVDTRFQKAATRSL